MTGLGNHSPESVSSVEARSGELRHTLIVTWVHNGSFESGFDPSLFVVSPKVINVVAQHSTFNTINDSVYESELGIRGLVLRRGFKAVTYELLQNFRNHGQTPGIANISKTSTEAPDIFK